MVASPLVPQELGRTCSFPPRRVEGKWRLGTLPEMCLWEAGRSGFLKTGYRFYQAPEMHPDVDGSPEVTVQLKSQVTNLEAGAGTLTAWDLTSHCSPTPSKGVKTHLEDLKICAKLLGKHDDKKLNIPKLMQKHEDVTVIYLVIGSMRTPSPNDW